MAIVKSDAHAKSFKAELFVFPFDPPSLLRIMLDNPRKTKGIAVVSKIGND